jgi:hypothetical protein
MNRKQKYESKFIKKSIRFTSKQYKHIEKQMTKTDECFTHYAHRILINKVTRVPSYLKAKQRISYELNKIGNNLNQLAKIAHQNGNIQTLQVFERIANQLKNIK